jgi:tRNA threonylcarbamoyl adenosine modification protein YeaZ
MMRVMTANAGMDPHEPVLIAVDAAVQPASLAVMRGESVASQALAPSEVHTDAWLSPAIDECLNVSGLRLSEIEGFAVTTGPGMFTGIRVGLATCLGLAAPRRLPVGGVITLEALTAAGASVLEGEHWIAPCIDARRGQVYGALYHVESSCALPLDATIEPGVFDPAAYIEAVAEIASSPRLIGSGTRYFSPANRSQEVAGEEFFEVPAGFSIGAMHEPLAVFVGRLVARGWTPEGPSRCHPPVPVYIRPADVRRGRNPLLASE